MLTMKFGPPDGCFPFVLLHTVSSLDCNQVSKASNSFISPRYTENMDFETLYIVVVFRLMEIGEYPYSK